MKLGGYVTEERGFVEIKGKNELFTYWLISADQSAIPRKESSRLSPLHYENDPSSYPDFRWSTVALRASTQIYG